MLLTLKFVQSWARAIRGGIICRKERNLNWIKLTSKRWSSRNKPRGWRNVKRQRPRTAMTPWPAHQCHPLRQTKKKMLWEDLTSQAKKRPPESGIMSPTATCVKWAKTASWRLKLTSCSMREYFKLYEIPAIINLPPISLLMPSLMLLLSSICHHFELCW